MTVEISNVDPSKAIGFAVGTDSDKKVSADNAAMVKTIESTQIVLEYNIASNVAFPDKVDAYIYWIIIEFK